MVLTERQKTVLKLVQEDLASGKNWLHRALNANYPNGTPEITWDEMVWLARHQKDGFATRIEAMFILDRVLRGENG